MKKVTNSSGFLQQRRGSNCTAAQSDAFLYPARHVFLILTCEFLITKHPINCLYTTLTDFSTKYLVMCKVYTDVGGIK